MPASIVRGKSYLPLLAENEPSSENPLANKTTGPPSRWQFTKRILVGVFLLPFRIICIILNSIIIVLLAKLATCGLPKSHFHALTGKPLRGLRLCIILPLPVLCRFQLFLLGFIWIRSKGRRASKSEAPIVVCNHVSGLVEGIYFGTYAKLAEASYLTSPAFGPIMMATQSILVDRADPDSRHNAKAALVRRGKEERWPQTVVFPEGACTNGSAIIQFKQGAFSPGVPVQPVVFRYPNKDYDVSFTEPKTTASYVIGMLLQSRNRMEVEYLPVYTPSPEEIQRPALFAMNVQQAMAKALGVPTTKHAAEDVALGMAAKSQGLPTESGVVQWQALTEQLVGVSVKDAKEALKRFAALDTKGEGHLDFETFAKAMRQSAVAEGENDVQLDDDELHGVFDLLDVSGDGQVNFAEYFSGVAVLNGHGLQEETASYKFMFDALAQGQTEFTKQQLDELLVRSVPTLSREQLDKLFVEADLDGNGLVTRDEFIEFAMEHKDDLNLRSRMLGKLPMADQSSENVK